MDDLKNTAARDTLRHQLDASLVAVRNGDAATDADALLAEIRRIDDFHDRATSDGIVVHFIKAAILRAEGRGITEAYALIGKAFDRAAE